MMTLDEAIKHLSIKSDTFSFQLLGLLEELRGYENDRVLWHKRAITKEQKGYNVAYRKALRILDSMFMEQGSISVDDWFRDSKNLFQGREVFKNKMTEE